jgi:hypothetical protein
MGNKSWQASQTGKKPSFSAVARPGSMTTANIRGNDKGKQETASETISPVDMPGWSSHCGTGGCCRSGDDFVVDTLQGFVTRFSLLPLQ